VCAPLVGLPDVTVLGVVDVAGQPIRVQVEQRDDRSACSGCGAAAWMKDRALLVPVRSWGG
jgi:hypothetical protein